MTINLSIRSLPAGLVIAVALYAASMLEPLVPTSHAQAIPAPAPTLMDPVTGSTYKADADMKAVLTALASFKAKPIENSSVDEARAAPTVGDAVNKILKDQGRDAAPGVLIPGVTSSDTMIPGAAGPIAARIYTPKSHGKFPIIVYFHGGGWVIADKQVYDASARGLAKASRAIVVSVDYRRAPEAKFPAAWDDALSAYAWVGSNADSLNGIPGKFALAGESAGGNLAVATAIAAIGAGLTPPRVVLAIYPVAQTGNMATDSYTDSETAKPLDKAMITWFTDKLVTNPSDLSDPRLDLVHAKLAGLPPVVIINAQIDPLRTDGVLLQQALLTAGVTVTRKVFPGVTHEFFGTAAVVAEAKNAQAFAGEELKRYLW